MKKRLSALLILLILLITSAYVPVHADDMWSEQYYRAVDTNGGLSDAEQADLDEECISFMKKYHQDMVLLAVDPDQYSSYGSVSDIAEGYYSSSDFGYGPGHDGFLWLYDTNAEKITLFCFGSAEGMIDQSYIDFAESSALELDGVYKRLYSGIRYVENYFEDYQTSSGGQPAGGSGGTAYPQGNLPSWFPADVSKFKEYHDEKAPRVVDSADIFTDAEERSLEARISEIRREIKKDIVIYTDVTDYGFGHDVCAADFYDFNGYGYGPDFEGVCLYIDMDPDNRGWWCCCTGPETRALYTEDTANNIDDVLYEYLASGEYAEGVADWIENIRIMYVKGIPFAPEWYPAKGETLTPHHDSSAPRVVDEAGLLTQAEIEKLSERAASISKKYGIDVAIHTQPAPYGMDYTDVGRKYYTYMGYGTGDDYDGIILNIFKRDGYNASPRIAVFGSVQDKLNETEAERMLGFVKDKTYGEHYYEAMSDWLSRVEYLEKTGRVARSKLYWTFVTAAGLIAGAIYGVIRLSLAVVKMDAPVEKREAGSYLMRDKSSVKDAGKRFLYTTSYRSYSPMPKKTSSGGGGSSGGHRSSYSSSYRGHSGRSHSGSGRRF